MKIQELRDIALNLSKSAATTDDNYDLRSYTCSTNKNLVDAFESVEFALRQSIEGRDLSVKVFAAENKIVATTIWNENISGFPPSYHQLDVCVQFVPAAGASTKAKVKWTALDFPRGHFTNQVVRRVNMRISMVLKAELQGER